MTTDGERGHRSIGHTADTIVEGWGGTVDACLEEVAAGLGEVYAACRESAEPVEVAVSVRGVDAGDLVLALCEECLYLLDARGRVVLGASLAVDADGLGARGTLATVGIDEIEVVGAVPKAVAEPELGFDGDRGLWRGSVIVDV